MRVVTCGAIWCPVCHKNELKNWMLEQPVFKHPVSPKGVLLSFGAWNFNKALFCYISRNVRIFSLRIFFLSLESYFLKYKRNIRVESSIYKNKRKFRYVRVLNISSLKYKKSSVMLGFWLFLSSSIRKVPLC